MLNHHRSLDTGVRTAEDLALRRALCCALAGRSSSSPLRALTITITPRYMTTTSSSAFSGLPDAALGRALHFSVARLLGLVDGPPPQLPAGELRRFFDLSRVSAETAVHDLITREDHIQWIARRALQSVSEQLPRSTRRAECQGGQLVAAAGSERSASGPPMRTIPSQISDDDDSRWTIDDHYQVRQHEVSASPRKRKKGDSGVEEINTSTRNAKKLHGDLAGSNHGSFSWAKQAFLKMGSFLQASTSLSSQAQGSKTTMQSSR